MITYKKWDEMSEKERYLSKAANAVSFGKYLEDHQDKKTQIWNKTSVLLRPTGFTFLDYGGGNYLSAYDIDENPLFMYHNVGIPMGSMTILLAATSGGKTTFAIQAGQALLEPYICRYLLRDQIEMILPKGQKLTESEGKVFMQIADAEKTGDVTYIKKLTHYTTRKMKDHVVMSYVSTDKDVMKLLERHAQYKVETMVPELMPMLDIYGQPIYALPPTVFIVDSITQLTLEDVDDVVNTKKGETVTDFYESAAAGSAGARRARIIGQLNTYMVNMAARYNIHIFSINHINKAPSMMGRPTRGSRMLRMGEAVSGGERPLYLASSVLRLDVIKDVGYEKSTQLNLGEGIKGKVAIASWIKSKSNSKSNRCHMVYTNVNGYDILFSGLIHCKENNWLMKKGNFYMLDDFPDKRFQFRFDSVYDTFGSNSDTFNSFISQMQERAEPLLDNQTDAARWEKKLMKEARQEIYDDYQNNQIDKSDAMDMDDLFASMIND